MSQYAREHPDRDPAAADYWDAHGMSPDRADRARKAAREAYAPRALPCPACHRESRMMLVAGCCPYEDCRHGSGS